MQSPAQAEVPSPSEAEVPSPSEREAEVPSPSEVEVSSPSETKVQSPSEVQSPLEGVRTGDAGGEGGLLPQSRKSASARGMKGARHGAHRGGAAWDMRGGGGAELAESSWDPAAGRGCRARRFQWLGHSGLLEYADV